MHQVVPARKLTLQAVFSVLMLVFSLGAVHAQTTTVAATAASVDGAVAASVMDGVTGLPDLPDAALTGAELEVGEITSAGGGNNGSAARFSQFQAFVRDSTGQSLPIFGANLFQSPQTFAPITNVSPPGNYVLGPGDQIQLKVWGVADFSVNLTVDRNGQVMVPRVGVLTVAGLRVEQLEPVMRTHVGRVFTNFELATAVSQLRSIQVYVVGHAQRPGTYTLSSLSTLVNALFASGGPSVLGSMRAIELRRNNQTITTLDLYEFIARGDQSSDVVLQPGDVIVIPPVGPQVAVHGAVDQPAIYELRDGETVGQILALGGGVSVLATTQVAVLERIEPQRSPARRVQHLSLDESGLQLPLQDGDVLMMLGISPAFANSVTLQGTVAAPLRFPYSQGMRLLDLIPEPDALITADYFRRKNMLVQTLNPRGSSLQDVRRQVINNFDAINWDYAVIERLDRQTLTNTLIPFNLGKAVLQRDPVHNLALMPGDVVTVFSQNDIRVPVERQARFVWLEGEVGAPGVYQLQAGETLPQLIRRAGGLTPQAYVFGTEFTRESVRQKQQQNLDQLISRLEASMQSQALTQIANLQGPDAARAASLQEAQLANQRTQLARLKTLRSNGRVALEIDPSNPSLAALPGVPLENGDRILIPAVPSFVAAFGAVNNENVFVHRPGRTVGDVLRLAGVSADAEISQMFVLRADGTVVANNSNGRMFNNFNSMQLMPGDTVVVPQKVARESNWNMILRNTRDITQILANLGLGLAALRTL